MTLVYYLKELLKDRKLMRDCVVLAVPIMLQTLVVSSVNLVDNLMVGQLGDIALSAVVTSNKYYAIISFVINAMISACSIYMAQYHGAQNTKKMQETYRFSFVSCYLLILVGFFIVLLFPAQLIRFIVNDSEVVASGVEYLKYACLSYLPMGISVAIAGSMRVVGDSKTPMFISVVSILVNAVLDYGLILGKFGLPMLGVAGAAIATVIARIIEAILYLWAINKGDYIFKSRFKYLFSFDRKLAKEIIVCAIPLVLNEFLWQLGMTFLMKAYSSRGTTINTAYSIASTVSEIFFILFSGMAVATTVLVGTPLGANKLEEAKSNGYKLICFSVLLSLVFGALMFLSGTLIPIIYSNVSKDAISSAQTFLKTIGCFYWTFMFNTQCFFTLRAGGDTKSLMFMDSGFMWCVNIPAVALLAYYTEISIYIVYMVGQATDIIKMIVSYTIIRKEKWVKNLTVENKQS